MGTSQECKKQVSKRSDLTLTRQLELLGLARSSYYYEPKLPSTEQLELEEKIKQCIDYWHTQMCFLGARGLKKKLIKEDELKVGCKLIKR